MNFNKIHTSDYYKKVVCFAKKPESKISGLLSLSFLTVALFGVFAIKPTFITIAELKRNIEDTKIVNQKLETKINALKTAQKLYAKIEKKISIIKSTLPENAEFERLAWQIQWLAQKENVEITRGSFGKFDLVEIDDPETVLQELSVDLSIMGSYESTINFISKLINIDRLIAIEQTSMKMQNLTKGEIQKLISTTLKLKAYYLPLNYVK